MIEICEWHKVVWETKILYKLSNPCYSCKISNNKNKHSIKLFFYMYSFNLYTNKNVIHIIK